MAMAKTTTASPATASQRLRNVGNPRRRLLQRSRSQPVGRPASIASSRTVGGSSIGLVGADAGLPGMALDQSVRRAAVAIRRSRSFVLRNDAR
jgi:hypothetical protein